MRRNEMDAVAFLERLAAEPKPFVAVALWLHEDGSIERKKWAPQPRRSMAQSRVEHWLGNVGTVCKTAAGTEVVLVGAEIEELA
jgi:hypothetical protein